MKRSRFLPLVLVAVSSLASEPTATVQQQNDRYEKQILERIAGRESEPAEEVFRNIQWLDGIPSARLLRIMNAGYSRALGVTCTHCHLESDFASDEKRPKRAAREMAVMHRAINEQLEAMKNLQADVAKRSINCNTCHRGQVSPLAASR
ncbi:MAG TPA: c-type cytochrome [Thermoanaerobaculia bacterium]|nr:c-type cytochrome [Thermoanaerobaculia bacterium]